MHYLPENVELHAEKGKSRLTTITHAMIKVSLPWMIAFLRIMTWHPAYKATVINVDSELFIKLSLHSNAGQSNLTKLG